MSLSFPLNPLRCCLRTHQTRSFRPGSISRKPRYAILAASSLQDLPLVKVMELEGFPEEPAVYAVYDKEEKLQYVGITRKLRMSIQGHMRDLPELTNSIRFETQPNATKDRLTGSWKAMIEEYVKLTGEIPPGNKSGNREWKGQRPRSKPEIKLTPGKGIEDLTISIHEIIDTVVKSNKVVAFIKGTRVEPKCGFSYQMLTILNKNRVDYDVVDVLDELHNPGLREAIKTYSQWPTIPQLFIEGEFFGGSDILTQMQDKGELEEVFRKIAK